jgi:hypothetical protein
MGQDIDNAESRTRTPARESSATEELQDAEKRRESDASSETAKSEDFENEMKALEESGEDTDELRRQYLLRRFWQTASGFWAKRGPPGWLS